MDQCVSFVAIYPKEYDCIPAFLHPKVGVLVLQPQTKMPRCWNWKSSIWAKGLQAKSEKEKNEKNTKRKNIFSSHWHIIDLDRLGGGGVLLKRKWVTELQTDTSVKEGE